MRCYIFIVTILAYLRVIILVSDLNTSISEKKVHAVWSFNCIYLMGYTKPCSHPLPPTPTRLQPTPIYFHVFLAYSHSFSADFYPLHSCLAHLF